MNDQIDILENELLDKMTEVLDTLLIDRTTHKNIMWCTHDYENKGKGYGYHEEIKPHLITGKNGGRRKGVWNFCALFKFRNFFVSLYFKHKTMSKIVYLLGAEASYGKRNEEEPKDSIKRIVEGLPVVNEIDDELGIVIDWVKNCEKIMGTGD